VTSPGRNSRFRRVRSQESNSMIEGDCARAFGDHRFNILGTHQQEKENEERQSSQLSPCRPRGRRGGRSRDFQGSYERGDPNAPCSDHRGHSRNEGPELKRRSCIAPIKIISDKKGGRRCHRHKFKQNSLNRQNKKYSAEGGRSNMQKGRSLMRQGGT